MADKLAYEIVSPEKLLAASEADQLVVPGAEGDFGVLAGHAPFMSTMRPGVISILGGKDGDEAVFVKGGLAQVAPEGLTILAEETMALDSVNREDLARQAANASEDLARAEDAVERSRIQGELEWMNALMAALS